MARNLSAALDAVETTYQDLITISSEMIAAIVSPMDTLVNEIREHSNNMPPDIIRDYIIRLQLRCYELAEPKDKAALKAQLAEVLKKEKYSQVLIEADGTAGVKDTKATLASSEEIVTEALYDLVASTLKTKLDSGYRLIDSLKSILMSRMQEAKFMNMGTSID